MTFKLDDLIGNQPLLIGASVLVLAVVVIAVRKVRAVIRSDRPDEPLANLVMVIGLTWSSDVVWTITREQLHLPIELTILMFFVFELALMLSMLRAKMHLRQFGWPGRFGSTAWGIAAIMSLVAATASTSLAEGVIRVTVPLTVTKLWWDGLVGGHAKKPESTSSWRWTPRRLLLAVGAIEPGERDVETVHRERLTQQMTKLEFARRHGSKRKQERRAARLARLSLKADDQIIKQVRQRVGRASWFTVTPLADAPMTHSLTQALTQANDAAVARLDTPSSRRTKGALTSNVVGGVDPATQAAQLYRSGEFDSIRKAAAAVDGAAEATVRRRLKSLPEAHLNGHNHELEEVQ